MINLSISEAQKQLTSILSKPTMVIDRKSNTKKAVILPYGVYKQLLKNARTNSDFDLDSFQGALSNDFQSDDLRYQNILK